MLCGMTDRLKETGRCYGMEMNVEKPKVMRMSGQPSPVQIMIDQKQLENVGYFNYKGESKIIRTFAITHLKVCHTAFCACMLRVGTSVVT